MSNRHVRKLRKEYAWRAGFRAPAGLEASDAARALHEIRERTGVMTADAIVSDAADESSPLHPAFEWNDEKCGALYRRHQAMTLVRAIIVLPTDTTPEHREFTGVTLAVDDESEAAEATEYKPTSDVVDRPDLFADAVARLSRKVGEAESSLRELENLASHVSTDADRMARIALASKGLDAAKAAIQGLN